MNIDSTVRTGIVIDHITAGRAMLLYELLDLGNEEGSVAIDDDPRACYFKQVLNGKYMRMALIMKLLKEAGTI